MSSLFRSAWRGSYTLVKREYCKIFSEERFTGVRDEIVKSAVENTLPLSNTEKFFINPTELYEGVVIVLKSPGFNCKGVLIIKYSYYFTLMFRLFRMDRVAQYYHIVLEPSWAGYADVSILAYTKLSHPVFVMTYESRDRQFLENLNSNLISVDVGPSWWVDHNLFRPASAENKNYDVVMVASWDTFKRHHKVFKALSKLRKEGHKLDVALAGYSTLEARQRIEKLAIYYNVVDQITFFEKIPPKEVSELFGQSKLNILWSRFEGNNRSIVEGMFCNVPAIVRDGHNYGERYFYINDQTGRFVAEKDLPTAILEMVGGDCDFSPREFVMSTMTYSHASKILEQRIANAVGESMEKTLALKVNELDGMRYVDPDQIREFSSDYEFLSEQLYENTPRNHNTIQSVFIE